MIASTRKIYGLVALLSISMAAGKAQAATCIYKVDSEWNTGFTASVVITNNTGAAINGWTVGWKYNINKMTSGWNAVFSGGNPYSAKDVGWNASIQPGQSVSFGLQGNKNGAAAERPTVTGSVCGGGASASAQKSSVKSIAKSSVGSVPKSSIKSSVIPTSAPKSSAKSSVRTSIVPDGPRLDNPFVSNAPTKWYVNQDWAQNARTFGGASIAGYNTAVWMDRIGAISPTDPNVMGLRDHLDAALDQGANLFLVVVYDLPNRDCFALASNGELTIKNNGFNRYKNEYVTPLAAILSDGKYKNIRIVAIIEPDSLPNLVTNTSDPDCQEAAGAGGYVEATQFTLNTLYPITNVYSYIDIGHSGWLGWPDNFEKATTLIGNAIKGTAHGVNSIAGFISNTANTTPLKEPFLDEFASLPMPGSNGGVQVRQAKFYEWNAHFSEFSFVTAWRNKMISNGFPTTIGMLVDTSRNGWGGAARPTKLSASTDVDKFVNESRIDRRTHRGMWCNQASGIGERPKAAPAPGLDAYVWIKPPGESDGASSLALSHDPTDPAKGFDRFCDPTFIVPAPANQITGALPNAPVAGRWFTDGFKALLKNAYPAL